MNQFAGVILMGILAQLVIFFCSSPGEWERGWGILNFVCYIGWAPASSVTPKKYTVYQPYPKNISRY